jgi:hypothetical protein
MDGETSLPFQALCFSVLDSCAAEGTVRVCSGRRVRPHAKFSCAEDDRLRRLVEALGPSNLAAISQHMGTKNTRQCRERWCNCLDSGLNRAEWSGDEDALLVRKYFELGAKWVQIIKFFPKQNRRNGQESIQ